MATETERYVRVSRSHDDQVITVELNRPEKRNAINHDMAFRLRDVMEDIRQDRVARIVILRGAGNNFCAGDDISEFPSFSNDDTAHGVASFMLREVATYQDTARAIEEMDKVFIAAVDGNCIGGGLELSMVCDLVIATARSNFGIPEIDIDLTPGWGGTSRLSRYVGRHKIKEMVLLGTLLDAEEARDLGLVNRVLPPDRLEAEVQAIVDVLLSKRPLILKLMKFITTKGLEVPLEGHLAMETLSAMVSFASGDGVPPAPPATREFVTKSGSWVRRRDMVRNLGF